LEWIKSGSLPPKVISQTQIKGKKTMIHLNETAQLEVIRAFNKNSKNPLLNESALFEEICNSIENELNFTKKQTFCIQI
jgi:hypothetical protein